VGIGLLQASGYALERHALKLDESLEHHGVGAGQQAVPV
jgi:hypothetical protein